MRANQFSRTALTVAAVRALVVLEKEDDCLSDPIAYELLTPAWQRALGNRLFRWLVFRIRGGRMVRGITCAVLSRSKLAEDTLEVLINTGNAQYILLGAGLDSYAYRNLQDTEKLKIFEVDFPATQALKQAQVCRAGLTQPANLIYVPCDFESESPAKKLIAHKLNPDVRSVIAWLGIVPYLSQGAIRQVLEDLASLSVEGSHIIFDYYDEIVHTDRAPRDAQSVLRATAAHGEPMISSHNSEGIQSLLKDTGWTIINDYDSESISARFFSKGGTYVREPFSFARLVHATRSA